MWSMTGYWYPIKYRGGLMIKRVSTGTLSVKRPTVSIVGLLVLVCNALHVGYLNSRLYTCTQR